QYRHAVDACIRIAPQHVGVDRRSRVSDRDLERLVRATSSCAQRAQLFDPFARTDRIVGNPVPSVAEVRSAAERGFGLAAEQNRRGGLLDGLRLELQRSEIEEAPVELRLRLRPG